MGKKITSEKPLKIDLPFEEAMKILIKKADSPSPTKKLLKNGIVIRKKSAKKS